MTSVEEHSSPSRKIAKVREDDPSQVSTNMTFRDIVLGQCTSYPPRTSCWPQAV